MILIAFITPKNQQIHSNQTHMHTVLILAKWLTCAQKINTMFGKLAEAQKKAEEIKQRLAGVTVQGQAASGDVTITMDGNKKVKDVNIETALLLPERKEELQDYLSLAIEDAINKADMVSANEMKSLMGGMMPGLGSLFGK